MAKTIITITDGHDGEIHTEVEFDPPLDPHIMPTRAQAYGYELAKLMAGGEDAMVAEVET